jgi:HAE1 family hydrophobic/amphiphilic exporter-1
MTAVLTLSVILFGVLSYFQLPVNDLPAVDYPVIQVQVGYPGASPDTIANNIATPLERQFMQINGLEVVTSQEHAGRCQLHAPVRARQEHRRRGDRRADRDLAGHRQSAGRSAFAADLFQDQSQRSADHVHRADQRFGHAGSALRLREHAGGPAHQHSAGRIAGERLRHQVGDSHQGRSGGDVGARHFDRRSERAIKNGTSYTGAGQLDSASGHRDVAAAGSTRKRRTVQQPDRRRHGGAPVYLRDVATLKTRFRTSASTCASGCAVTSAVATVIVAVNRRAGANAVEVSKSIRDIAAADQRRVAGLDRITPIYDRSLNIVHSVNDVQDDADHRVRAGGDRDLCFSRPSHRHAHSRPSRLPLSLLITFIAMRALGYSLDNLSLMALTLAIGFLVDDAIVFLENTVRRMERGEQPFEAAINSAKEISFTIMSMTISLAAVFIPLVFMTGLVGESSASLRSRS